jgi:hypothetical protein
MGLQDELNSMLEKSMARIPKETASIMATAMGEVQNLNLTDSAKRKGDTAPDFELTDATGEIVSLKSLLSGGPAVISFYRGSW